MIIPSPSFPIHVRLIQMFSNVVLKIRACFCKYQFCIIFSEKCLKISLQMGIDVDDPHVRKQLEAKARRTQELEMQV